MTEHIAAAQRLIHAALARADIERRGLYGREYHNTPLTEAADAYRALDPTGSELARLAEIGAVVERLEQHRWWKAERDAEDGVCVYIREPSGWLDGCGITLPAAIAAALQEPGT